MRGEREVAGLWCSDVLARLEDAVDGALAVDERRRVEAHVAGCTACAQFGARYAALVDALRQGALDRDEREDAERSARVLDVVWRAADER